MNKIFTLDTIRPIITTIPIGNLRVRISKAVKRAMSTIRPFKISIPEPELRDLRYRVMKTRFPDSGPEPLGGAEGDPHWGMGTPLSFMEKVRNYWLDDFDWRKQERELNQFHHYKCVLEDHENIELHFIHEKAPNDSRHRKAVPILLIHGWPGSIWEFHEIIPLLVTEGYDVVAASLPGFGFSSAPKNPGWNTGRVASAMNSLMVNKLKYTKYFAQGGDWAISKKLGANFSTSCIAIHVNMVIARPPGGQKVSEALPSLKEEDLKKLAKLRQKGRWEFAYQIIQGTRPQTLGYGLNDSPMGLAAWILEKFSAWSDTRPDRNPIRAVSMDDMLTNVCIYWFSKSITSSMRIYYEEKNSSQSMLDGKDMDKPTVPAAYCEFPEEIYIPPESWVRDCYNIQQWTKSERGGHFAALEQPEFLAKDIVLFFNKQLSKSKL